MGRPLPELIHIIFVGCDQVFLSLPRNICEISAFSENLTQKCLLIGIFHVVVFGVVDGLFQTLE
jgi:hypothetical protein